LLSGLRAESKINDLFGSRAKGKEKADKRFESPKPRATAPLERGLDDYYWKNKAKAADLRS
jgi:hypothetical protein